MAVPLLGVDGSCLLALCLLLLLYPIEPAMVINYSNIIQMRVVNIHGFNYYNSI